MPSIPVEIDVSAFQDLDSIVASPLTAADFCRRYYAKKEGKYRDNVHKLIVRSYAVTHALMQNRELWIDFANGVNGLKVFKRAVRPNNLTTDILLVVQRFIFGESHGYNRAYRHARALELYRLEQLSPSRVDQRLRKDGGIDKLYELALRVLPRKGRSKLQQANDQLSYQAAAKNGVGWLADLDMPPNDNAAKTGRDVRKTTSSLLEVALSPKRLKRILSGVQGQQFQLTVEIGPTDKDGFKQVHLVEP